MIKRPSSVKIFGQKYRVAYDLHEDPEEQDTYGLTLSTANLIRLRNDMQSDKMARVFMHEVTHAIIDESTMAGRKRFDVEEVCDIVGFHIVDMLKDNQSILEWLLKEAD